MKSITISELSQKTNEVTEVPGKEIKEQNFQVRIVILNFDDHRIGHHKVTVKGKNFKVYSGKKVQKKSEMNQLVLRPDSPAFNECSNVRIESQDGVYLEGNPRGKIKYYGILYCYREENHIVVVNQVDLETYVAAVVGSEIGGNAPMEALKAQAICSRTYICNEKAEPYKKYQAQADDSTDYQVYNYQPPTKQCFKAAKETKNMILTYGGKPIKAYYFSTSCGYTTNGRIWGREKQPYLKGVQVASKYESLHQEKFEQIIRKKGKGYEKKCPYFRWNCYLSAVQIEQGVRKLMGVDIGHLERIEIHERGEGGVALQMTVYGDLRQVVVNNQMQIRKILVSPYMILKLQDGTEKSGLILLPSAFISVDTIYNRRVVSGVKIYGGGYGHGSGMSQNGAIEMAKKGKTYQEILEKFYHKVRIQKRTAL
ncbi:MAG: SpoIID/LytB domain-containing protein [Eubacterium sp.]|nr:SpoIID/LytB domain-containing protein [Eubacterium sp.]